MTLNLLPLRATFFSLLLACLASAYTTSATAHGSTEPKHGGVVIMVGEMTFELVTKPNRVELYLVDEAVDVDSSKLSAKLKLKSETPPRYIDLSPIGGNGFAVEGVTLNDGDKVMALVTLANGYSKIGANFVVGEEPKH